MSKSINFKHTIARALFAAEFLAVIGLYVFGGQGLYPLHKLNRESGRLQQEIIVLTDEIAKLEAECLAWSDDTFYVEQAAREKLAMARDGEQIYVIK